MAGFVNAWLLLKAGKANLKSRYSADQIPLLRVMENFSLGSWLTSILEMILGRRLYRGLLEIGLEPSLLPPRHGQVDINSRTVAGQNPLTAACHGDHEAGVKELLRVSEDGDDSGVSGRNTPSTWGANTSREDIVKLLLKTRKVNLKSNFRS
ncbi:uncharacterized protein RSE6_06982 [Rhynchosporium secalis]|uniref:Uncharacterized protein n=1 Tax=Rhynchosporium secalis TaxID=38038 RepID=A0A1E1MBQ3_RHYSE|nr:uncharacterized protein RSE6_06982 [Rhynchosporium secalis]